MVHTRSRLRVTDKRLEVKGSKAVKVDKKNHTTKKALPKKAKPIRKPARAAKPKAQKKPKKAAPRKGAAKPK